MPIKLPSFRARRDVYPADLWTKCPSCEEQLFNKQLDKTLRVCPNCGHHFRLSAKARLDSLLDESSFEERDPGLQSVDPLGFVDQKTYPDRVAAAQVATGMRDAAVWGTGTVAGYPVVICVMDFGFMGGSMGAVVGEKVARAAEAALETRTPLVVVSASRRGADAGGDPRPDAAGQDRRGHRAAPDGRRAVRVGHERPDHRRRVRLVRRARRRQPGRAERAHRLRRGAGQRRDDRRRAARRASSARSSCSATGSSTGSSTGASCGRELAALLAFLEPAELQAADEEHPGNGTLPAFRPLSFLTALADKVIPEGDTGVAQPAGSAPAGEERDRG